MYVDFRVGMKYSGSLAFYFLIREAVQVEESPKSQSIFGKW